MPWGGKGHAALKTVHHILVHALHLDTSGCLPLKTLARDCPFTLRVLRTRREGAGSCSREAHVPGLWPTANKQRTLILSVMCICYTCCIISRTVLKMETSEREVGDVRAEGRQL